MALKKITIRGARQVPSCILSDVRRTKDGQLVCLHDAAVDRTTNGRGLLAEVALANLGRRYDVGAKYGLLTAQLALALEGADRDEVLAQLVELLALRNA